MGAAVLAITALVVLLLLACSVGSTGFHWVDWSTLGGSANGTIVTHIRLPRALGAIAAGALLGLSGAIAQGLFRNPLADPYLLGSAAGASLLVALTMLLLAGGLGMALHSGNWYSQLLLRLGLTGAAFIGSVLAVGLTIVLSRGAQNSLRLLLAGVIVGVILGAGTQLIMLIAPTILQAMQGFMLGNTAFVGWSSCAIMAGVWLVSIALATLGAHALDALMLGESTAQSLGVPLRQQRLLLILLLALTCGTAVAHTGLIAFVGLAAPHLARHILSTGYRHLLWFSSMTGAVLLLSADIVARWILAPQELAVGIVTALLGGVYLLVLMHRQGQQHSGLGA